MTAQEWKSAPLQPVLRLIHCIQKERGASCALVSHSLALRPNDASADGGSSAEEEEHPFESNLKAARIASNSAISSFYGSAIWRDFCARNDEGNNDMEIATKLFGVRQLVDGGLGDEKENFFFHVVIVEYNQFLSNIINVFAVKEFSKRKRDIQMKTNTPKMLNEARRNAKVALSLLDLILCFVTLKESLGMERATLSGLMANDTNAVSDEEGNIEVFETQNTKDGVRLNRIVNDLVMVVENQHQIMRNLQRQSGLNIFGSARMSFVGGTPEVNELLLDDHYCTLLRLVGDSVKQSDAMLSLQDHFRKDFDINSFQQSMSMAEFWKNITLYMDQLHSMELFLLEELENCEGGCENLDLLSLERQRPSQPTLNIGESALSLDVSSRQSAIQVVSKMTQEEMKDTLVSLLTQDCKASKLIASPDRGDRGNNTPSTSLVRTTDDRRPSLADQHAVSANTGARHRRSQSVDAQLEEWEISLYEVEFHKRIGRGSAGTTYLGKYANQDVAVKVAATSDMGLEGWKAELTSLKRMHHKNIIRFLGAIYNPSPLTYCLVLEYCDGGDLSVALAGTTPDKFFLNVTSDIARGLKYLHNKKYMHRDIKPSNVLLSGELKSGQFTAKLTDFGLAVKMQNTSVTNGKKELTAETGTYRYMAPEVIRHECYNYAADIYSFGLLMWEIITREKPFEPKSQIEAAGSVALEGKRPPFPNGIPLTIKTLIQQCWASTPTERIDLELIIKCLDEMNSDTVIQSWLAAPRGHPVYKPVAQEQPPQGMPASITKANQMKKASIKKNWTFRKKKK